MGINLNDPNIPIIGASNSPREFKSLPEIEQDKIAEFFIRGMYQNLNSNNIKPTHILLYIDGKYTTNLQPEDAIAHLEQVIASLRHRNVAQKLQNVSDKVAGIK